MINDGDTDNDGHSNNDDNSDGNDDDNYMIIMVILSDHIM